MVGEINGFGLPLTHACRRKEGRGRRKKEGRKKEGRRKRKGRSLCLPYNVSVTARRDDNLLPYYAHA